MVFGADVRTNGIVTNSMKQNVNMMQRIQRQLFGPRSWTNAAPTSGPMHVPIARCKVCNRWHTASKSGVNKGQAYMIPKYFGLNQRHNIRCDDLGKNSNSANANAPDTRPASNDPISSARQQSVEPPEKKAKLVSKPRRLKMSLRVAVKGVVAWVIRYDVAT
jgi:hypothetical protein